MFLCFNIEFLLRNQMFSNIFNSSDPTFHSDSGCMLAAKMNLEKMGALMVCGAFFGPCFVSFFFYLLSVLSLF